MLEVEGSAKADYFHVNCAGCAEHVDIEYLGYIGGVPAFHASCSKCGEQARFKLLPGKWTGLPTDKD